MSDPTNPTIELTLEQRFLIRQGAERLKRRYAGVLSAEMIERLLLDSYDRVMETARVPDWVPLLAERFADDRLRALSRLQAGTAPTTPSVLFLGVGNAGRSQMAAGWLRHLAGEGAEVFSGGSEPAEALDRDAIAAMAEVGIDIAAELPKPLSDEIVRAADIVVTMSCGDARPVAPGKRHLDWDLDDPAGKGVEEIRPIRDEIEHRVRALMVDLGVTPQA